MSAKYVFSQTLKEVRFLFCQTGEHSGPTRYVCLFLCLLWQSSFHAGVIMAENRNWSNGANEWDMGAKGQRETAGRTSIVENRADMLQKTQILPRTCLPNNEEEQPKYTHHAP